MVPLYVSICLRSAVINPYTSPVQVLVNAVKRSNDGMVVDGEARVRQAGDDLNDTILVVMVPEDITDGRDLVDVDGSEVRLCWEIDLEGGGSAVRLTALSFPLNVFSLESYSVTSPVTISTSSGSTAGLGDRVSEVTAWPRSTSSAQRWRPTNPSPPSTRTFIHHRPSEISVPGRVPRHEHRSTDQYRSVIFYRFATARVPSQ